MREMLFRGKRLDNGEWYEGSHLFLHVPMSDWTGRHRGPAKDVHYIVDQGDMNYAVDPETVGQCTGVMDMNGKRIFDGDVIIHYNRPGDSAAHVVGVVFWDEESCSFKKRNIFNNEAYDLSPHCDYEIIGNIYDNPELMEVT